jgi:tetratricopeptide (TPR) repeat protein
MDCEKFDQVLIDALYDELDELTLAAAKRHADGCPRCQAAWSGLKATRKIGILPLVEAPAGLDERIMAAAREAQRNVAWPKRLGRAVSWAGNYAMRPQAAMAAILLLMLGSSVIFVRAKPDRRNAASEVRVTERGVPVSAAAPPPPPPAPMVANEERSAAAGSLAAAPSGRGLREPAAEPEQKIARADKSEGFAEPPVARARRGAEFATAPSDSPQPAPEVALGEAARASDMASTGGAAPSKGAAMQKDAYTSALDLYGAGRYAEAEKAFRQVAASDSKNAPQAALFAAKSAEAAFGCGKAAPMYEAAASRYGATTPGAESLWGAANCYKAIGSLDKATIFYNELRKVAGYRDRAEAELASLRASQQNRVAARKAASSGPPAAAAAAPAAPASRPAATRDPASNAAERPAP